MRNPPLPKLLILLLCLSTLLSINEKASAQGASMTSSTDEEPETGYGRFGQRLDSQRFYPFSIRPISRHHVQIVNRTPFTIQVELTGHKPFTIPRYDFHLLSVREISRKAILHFSYTEEDYLLFQQEGWQKLEHQLGPQVYAALREHQIWADEGAFGGPIPETDQDKEKRIKRQKLATARALKEMENSAKEILMNTPVNEIDLIKVLENAQSARRLVENLIENECLYRASQGQWNRYTQPLHYEETRYVRNNRLMGKRKLGKDVRGGPNVSANRGMELMGVGTTLVDENLSTVLEGVGFRTTQALGREANVVDQMYLRFYISGQTGIAFGKLRDGEIRVESRDTQEELASYQNSNDFSLSYLYASGDVSLRATIRPRYVVEGGLGIFGFQGVGLGDSSELDRGTNLGSRSVFNGIHPYAVGRIAWMLEEDQALFPMRSGYLGLEVKSYIWNEDKDFVVYLEDKRLSATRTPSPQFDIALTWGTNW